ncbi:MAG: 3-isopropylmalate dehydratase large subunit [Holophagales bacterium]|nr:3-isopropylmalate dehydratase large subunit [Holophagales bacterium]
MTKDSHSPRGSQGVTASATRFEETPKPVPARPRTLFEKIWQCHVVEEPEEPGMPSLLYVDLHLLHEVTSPQAFAELVERGLRVRRPERTVATMDHSTPTDPSIDRNRLRVLDAAAAAQLDRLEASCREHGIPLFALGDDRQGIVHVIGPELGLTRPGFTIVCGDSHTSTHGAFGALAFGIGTSEVAQVLATQTLLQKMPGTFEICLEGTLGPAVTPKDLILGAIARIGVHGGTGHVLEYSGSAIRDLCMEGRMTVCNMSIEAGARAGLIAPDDTTFAYLKGRPYSPTGRAWDAAVATWRGLATDAGASYDRRVLFDANELEPMITWGTHPGTAIPVGGRIPRERDLPEANRAEHADARRYMGFGDGQQLLGTPVDVVFVGSCTNSRLSDLEAVAHLLDGKKIPGTLRMLVVPGSARVKAEAEELGLHEVFRAAGAEWREPGCSMCLAMNGDRLRAGQLAVSTSNRNFRGRQGPGGRTLLTSPLTAAATAVRGRITDPRELL